MEYTFKKILVVRLSSLGDIIHTLPAVLLLRESYPNTEIDWVVKRRYEEILTGNRVIDQVIPAEFDKWRERPINGETFSQILGFAKKLKGMQYDLVIDFQGSMKSGLISGLTKSPIRVSFAPPFCREPLSALFANRWVKPKPKVCHKVERSIELLNGLKLKEKKILFPLEVPKEAKSRIDGFLRNEVGSRDFKVALNPGARWETKRWPVEYWAKLADQLMLQGLKVIFVWGPGEKESINEIVKWMKGAPIIAPPTNLKELLSLIKRTNLFIAGDTGPLHMAAALNVPVIGLYGPTDPILNGPHGQLDRVIVADVNCTGCWKRSCGKLDCMRSITPERVLELAIKMRNNQYLRIPGQGS